jgi:hypothetical protein
MRCAVFLLLALGVVTGCATVQAATTRSTQDMLAAAGFHAQPADTPQQIAELQSLPARRLLSRTQDGAVSYVFSDPAGCHCLYVGGDREYREYQRLRLQQRRADEKSRNCQGWPWCNGFGG